jgi:beta-lactamase class A
MFKKILVGLVVFIQFVSVAGAAPLDKEIMSDLKSFNGKVGIYAKNLRTGKVIEYNEDTVFPTASTSKLVVALATYKYLYPQASADKRNFYETDIQYMITVSDNASFDELLNEIAANKPDALQKVERDLRLKQTQIHSEAAFEKYQYHSVTTPYEMAKVLEAIYRDRYLGKDKSNVLKYQLANTIYNEEIPRYMLTPVMHKVGELDDVLCDVGIVDDGKDRILISAYTRTPTSEQYASDFIANISAKLYNALRRK